MLLDSPNVHPPLKNNQRNKANLNCKCCISLLIEHALIIWDKVKTLQVLQQAKKIFDHWGDVLICLLTNTSAPSHWLKSVEWPVGPVLKFRDISDWLLALYTNDVTNFWSHWTWFIWVLYGKDRFACKFTSSMKIFTVKRNKFQLRFDKVYPENN